MIVVGWARGKGWIILFILTPLEIRAAIARYLKDRQARGTSDAKWQSAIRWKDAVDQENKWEKLTS